jgi:aspartate racemase
VFDELSARSPIPLISIVASACEEAVRLQLETVGLLGTRFTMQGRFYNDVFSREGITVRPPAAADAAFVHERYMRELVVGEFQDETRQEILAIIARLRADGAQGVLLAGTELPLLLRGSDTNDVPLIDTTRIHVSRAVTALVSQ